MNGLVKIDGKRVFTTTLILSKGVGIEHRAVMSLLKTHSKTETLSTFQMLKVSRGGRPVNYAQLDELQATFLITLMRNSEKVVLFKEKLTKEFYQQRNVIAKLISQQRDPNWQNVRSDGKIIYKKKTDIIKQFVDYATKQGSSSATRYYSNLAKMENKALFFIEQKYKNLRDIMTIKQLMQACTADDVIEKALIDGMNDGLPYKDIYLLAKERVISFASIIGKSPVHDMAIEDNSNDNDIHTDD